MTPTSTMEELFNAKLKQDRASRESTSSLSLRQYNMLIQEILAAKLKKTQLTPSEKLLLEKYDVQVTANRRRLIVPTINMRKPIFYVHDGNLFETFNKAHLPNHASRGEMMKKLKNTYKNIENNDIMIFLSLCEECVEKNEPSGTDLRTAQFNNQCSVDLIDYRAYPDDEFNYMLVYQEMFTKFSMLKPLKSREPKEVAENLYNFFGIFGPPKLLQSNCDAKFVEEIIDILINSWPCLKIGRVTLENTDKSSTQDVESLMANWMRNNSKSRWSEGVRFAQLKRNTTFHPEIKQTPYNMLFNYSEETLPGQSDVKEQEDEDEEQMNGVDKDEEQGDEVNEDEEQVDEVEEDEDAVKEDEEDVMEVDDSEMEEETMEICKTEPELTCSDCGQAIKNKKNNCTSCGIDTEDQKMIKKVERILSKSIIKKKQLPTRRK